MILGFSANWHSLLINEGFRQYVELSDALHRFDGVDANQFPPGGIGESLDNVARCHAELRINAVSVQLFSADYQGLFYERPSTAGGIFKLALDDTRLGIVTDVPNYADFHAYHCFVPLLQVSVMAMLRQLTTRLLTVHR